MQDDSALSKTCRECGTVKPLEEFPRRAAGSDGRRRLCKLCYYDKYRPSAQQRRKYYETRRAKPEYNEYNANYRAANRDKWKVYNHAYRFAGHGTTEADYLARLDAQGGRCAICGSTPDKTFDLVIDHDHGCCPGTYSCGTCIRGLLCGKCNTLLGCAGDNPAVVSAALSYLHRK